MGAVATTATRRRWLWPAGAAAVLAVAAAVVLRPTGGEALTVRVDRPAPAFELPDVLPGRPPVSLARAGGRPVVVNFWASWCVPCRAEMPALQAASRRLAGRVAFLGVNHRDGAGAAADLLTETGVTYPSGRDPEGRVAVAFGARGMPTTAFVDAGGTVVELRTGPLTSEQLLSIVERLFPA